MTGEDADEVDEAPGDVGWCILRWDKLRSCFERRKKSFSSLEDRYSFEAEASVGL